MKKSPDENLTRLQELFAELPGIGPRSAQRIVTELMTRQKGLAQTISDTLSECIGSVRHCPVCHTLTTKEMCAICSDKTRDRGTICVVESTADQQAIEDSFAYRGLYFVLMGRVNPVDNVGPHELGVDRLLKRASDPAVREVVLATSYTPEGETTAHLILGLLRKFCPNVRVTRLARGLPSGVEVEYTDAATLASAVIERKKA